MTMKYLTTLLCSAAALLSVACIENDIPYPEVEIFIDSMTGEGFTAVSDASARTVVLTLDEQTDIQRVRIDDTALGVTPHATSLTAEELIPQVRTSQPLTGEFDLRTPLYTTLSLYQDYDWTIRAQQQIERFFAVDGQVGTTQFDPQSRTATAYVAKDADLSHVVVSSLKLGPTGITTYSPTLEELSGTSFETVRFVDVTCHGRTERWLLYVKHTDKSVELTGAYAWSKVIWLYGSGIQGVESGFRYRTGDDTEWHEVLNVTSDGGSFSAHLAAEPETQYTIMAYCGSDQTEPLTVVTDPVQPLLNGSFEEWSTDDDIVYPYLPGTAPYWSTGNKGAKIASTTLTDKCPPRPGSTGQYAAYLKSQFANLVGLGKFAAGNLFLGHYVRNEGTNGILTFGRKFSLRPTKLRIWVKYHQGIIDKLKSVPVGSNIKLGDPDNGHIYIALGTWSATEYGKDSRGNQVGTDDSPICVDTRDVATFFKPDGKDVIAYGEYVFDADTEKAFADSHVDGWVTMDIQLNYRVKNVAPTHMMIVCSASRWGDYFTGSTKSEMWVDDFELIYDE